MIVFYIVLLILAVKYRYVPFDAYDAWREERRFVEESLKAGAGIDSPQKPRHLRLVK